MKQYEKLSRLIKGNIILSAPMRDYTTYKIGGPADCLIEVSCNEDITETLCFGKENDIPVMIIGNGSNLLVSDDGIEGIVIVLGREFSDWKIQDDILYGQCGALLSKVAVETARSGYRGLQWAAGIPASLGGATYMNAGAFGHQFYNNIIAVHSVDMDGNYKLFRKEDLHCDYRSTSFMENKCIITGVEVKLQKDSPEDLNKEVSDILTTRRKNQPLEYPSCGSVFKNPEGSHAGYLVEITGLRGTRIGDVAISEKHGNFIVNLGNGKASDVLALINLVKKEVYEHQGYTLEPEVRLCGRL